MYRFHTLRSGSESKLMLRAHQLIGEAQEEAEKLEADTAARHAAEFAALEAASSAAVSTEQGRTSNGVASNMQTELPAGTPESPPQKVQRQPLFRLCCPIVCSSANMIMHYRPQLVTVVSLLPLLSADLLAFFPQDCSDLSFH